MHLVEESKFKGVRGEWIGGPFDGLAATLNGVYEGLVVVLVCDYSGRFAHVKPECIEKYFKPTR